MTNLELENVKNILMSYYSLADNFSNSEVTTLLETILHSNATTETEINELVDIALKNKLRRNFESIDTTDLSHAANLLLKAAENYSKNRN